MKLFPAMSRRRTLLCVATVLLFLVVMMAFVHAQDDMADAATDSVGEPVAHDTSTATGAAVKAAKAKAAAAKEREAREQARRQEERQRQEAEMELKRKAAEARRLKEEEDRAREYEERAKRRIDSVDMIRYSAKELPQGCVKAVEEYLFRVHEHRQRTAAAVRDARSELNEARVHAPSKVAELEKRLATKQDDLLVYDIETLRMYGGDIPKTCIAEAQDWLDSQPAVTSTSDTVQVYTQFARFIIAHCKTLYLTARGVVQYMISSYTPVVASYTKSAQYYYDKAEMIYTELWPASGKRQDMLMMEFAKKFVVMMGHMSVPICLGATAGILALAVLPPVAVAVVMYEYLYKVWVELFIAYYIYGAKMPDGAIMTVKNIVAAVQEGKWDSIFTNATEAFMDLLVDVETVFYNGVIIILLLANVVMVCGVFMCVWYCYCVPRIRGKKSARPLKSALGSASGGSTVNTKNAATPGAAAAALAAKKKN
ncbi:hypothetical protein Q4I28_004005 [Leishmania naiffi]|uniref:Uncharacterized protein n=1 Tax=Leishmania naiffi TaxID=5678 RepID=A0AAW3BR68_9TRYP